MQNSHRGRGIHSVPSSQKFIANEWKPLRGETLRGSFTLTMPDGIIVQHMELHEAPAVGRWIVFPKFIDFDSPRTHTRFRREALAALDHLLLGIN